MIRIEAHILGGDRHGNRKRLGLRIQLDTLDNRLRLTGRMNGDFQWHGEELPIALRLLERHAHLLRHGIVVPAPGDLEISRFVEPLVEEPFEALPGRFLHGTPEICRRRVGVEVSLVVAPDTALEGVVTDHAT